MKKIPLSYPTYGLVSTDRFLAQFQKAPEQKKEEIKKDSGNKT